MLDSHFSQNAISFFSLSSQYRSDGHTLYWVSNGSRAFTTWDTLSNCSLGYIHLSKRGICIRLGFYTKYKREKDLKAFSTNPLRTLSSEKFPQSRGKEKRRFLHNKCHWKSTNCQLTKSPAPAQAVVPRDCIMSFEGTLSCGKL